MAPRPVVPRAPGAVLARASSRSDSHVAGVDRARPFRLLRSRDDRPAVTEDGQLEVFHLRPYEEAILLDLPRGGEADRKIVEIDSRARGRTHLDRVPPAERRRPGDSLAREGRESARDAD